MQRTTNLLLMPLVLLVPLMLGGALFTACGSDSMDACLEIEGRTYLSVEQHECGQDPNGPVLCNWSLRFDTGSLMWAYSDIAAAGTYTCDGAGIVGVFSTIEFTGTIAEDGILTWNNIDYAPASPPAGQ